MARHWPPPDGPSLPDYLDQLTRDLEEARSAMADDDARCAKRWVRHALGRPSPEAVNAAETAVLAALALAVLPDEAPRRIAK